MRIVSQDRNHSFKFDNIELWTQNTAIYAKMSGVSIVLGMYETKERVAEIFEDIHNAYAPVTVISTKLTEEQVKQFIDSENIRGKCITIDEEDVGVTTYSNRVYYMPEK